MTPPVDPLDPIAVAAEIDREVRVLPAPRVQSVRAVRRAWSRRLRAAPAEAVVAVAMALSDRQRWVACELLYHHPGALDHLGVEEVERLGEGMADWGSVDAFGCLVSGPVWRRGGIPDVAVHRWAASPDRWWRRAALVSTVPLNLRSRKGTGDTGRTLDICRRLVADGDDMVVKALSWALRQLVVWDPEAVRRFLDAHHEVLAARVRREVRSKLETGRKYPVRRRPDPRSGQPVDRVSRRMSRKYVQPCWWSGTDSGGQAVVDQAQGGRADLLGEVDLDGGAPSRDAEPAVLPLAAGDLTTVFAAFAGGGTGTEGSRGGGRA